DRLTSLFRKYVANTITKSELDELMQLIDQVDDQLWSELIDSSVNPEPADGLKPPFRKAVLFDEIEKQVDSDSLPETWRFNAKKWVAIAASILIAFAVGYSWYNRHLHENREEYVDLSDIQ